ncbi:unnamed protein product [Closterium sp. NIES-53]
MYALYFSAEGDCYWCVPPDLGIAAGALGASASGTPPGTALVEAFHSFTLDSGASRCFFRDSTTLTLLPTPVLVRLADPFGGPVVASSSTVLPCSAVPSSSLSGLHLPSFSAKLVSTAALQDAMVTTTTPGGSSLYTLATEPPQVAASAQVSAPGQVAASCSCLLLSHQTLLWYHCLGHPSLPRLRGMHSRLLVSGLPRSLPPLPPSPAPPCLPCVEGRQRAASHSSSFPPTTAPLQTLHMDVDGEFSSDLLRDFYRGEGITQSFMLPNSPQQNGIAERRLGLVMEVASTSMIHAAAPHFLWPFAVRYAEHQLNLWPRETSPTRGRLAMRWCFGSGDVTFDESVPFYRLFPYRSAPPPPPSLFLAPGPPQVDPLPPQGPSLSSVSQVDPLSGTAPVQVAVVSGAAPDIVSGGATSGGAEPGGARSEGAGSGGVEPGGAESESAKSGGVEPRGADFSGGPTGASPRLSSQLLREWLVQCAHHQSGAPGAGGTGDPGAGGTSTTGPGDARTVGAGATGTGGVGCAGTGDPTEPGAAGAGGAGAGVAGVGGASAGGTGTTGAGAVDPGAGGAGGTVRPHPYFVPLLQQSGGFTELRELASRPVSPGRTAPRAPRLHPPPVPRTHTMALRPSSVPLRVPLLAPFESSLPEVPDPESDRVRAASPTVARLLVTAVTDPSFESAAASALIAELLDFVAACRLDYASALVAESVPASPPSVGGESALGTDVLEDRQEDFECLAATVPRFASLLLAPEGDPDAPDIPTPRFYAEAITGSYVDEVPQHGANMVDGIRIFRVKRLPGSPPAFKARYVARGFSQRQGVDYFQTSSPTPKLTNLRVLLHLAAQRDYELHSLDFSTSFLQGSLHEEIWLRRPPGFTGTFPAGTQWSLRRPVYGLRQAPREWHDTLRTILAAPGFAPSTADPSLFLRTDTSLPPLYVLVYVLQRLGFQYSLPQLTPLSTSHSLSAPPSDESIEPSGPYPELMGCLITSGMGLVLGGRGPVVLTGYADASWAEIYAGAMAAQELRWLTYVLTDLEEQPRSPPVLYVDNKAMIALCQEHRLEHRTKHIALRYFLARELQQRGQLRLAYLATRANTADVFTKALRPSDCWVQIHIARHPAVCLYSRNVRFGTTLYAL